MTTEKPKTVKPKTKRDPNLLRKNRISVRFTDTEVLSIQTKAKSKEPMTIARFIRNSVMDSLPLEIPKINQESWVKLSGVASNLNQLQRRINSNQDIGIDEIKKLVSELRDELIGVKFDKKIINKNGEEPNEQIK